MSSAPNDENDIVTIGEVVEYQTRNLAGCDNDDGCCTFPKGYVFRQALYLCLTCLKSTGMKSGVCYPCSVNCHNGHDLLDLYTKRNFRCDCGNGSFPSENNCKLWEEKDDLNINNVYNDNYSGVFCVCKCQYDESEETEEMHQCNICEDWYHLTHLSEKVEELTTHKEDIDSSKEFTCKLCIKNLDYLNTYNQSFLNNLTVHCPKESCSLNIIKQMLSDLPPSIVRKPLSCGAFWPDDWRQRLCHCPLCKSTIPEFLFNEMDTMSYYYSQFDVNEHNEENELKEVLSELPYTQAITIAEGIANCKRKLSEFLNAQDPNQIVTTEDVKSFFDNLKKGRLDEQE